MPPLAAVVGWRRAFVLAARLGALVHGAVRLWLPPPRERVEDEARLPPPCKRAEGEAPAASGVPVREVLRIGVLWRFSLMLFGYAALMWGLSTWIPSYLSSERGLSLTSAGVFVAVPSLAAALGTLLGGRLSDRFEGHHRKVAVPAMSVAAPALCLMALSPGLIGSVACGTIAVFAASLCYMPIFAVPMRSLAPELVGVGSAVIVFGGQVAGMVVPPVLGLLVDAVSFEAAFAVLALGPVVAAVLALVTPQDTESFTAALPHRGSHALIEKEPT